jgi:spermidine dehydrogenase
MGKFESGRWLHAKLGMDMSITRRDFLNATLLGTGAMLLDMKAPINLFAQTPGWYGYGGGGDYSASHGNTPEIIKTFQDIQNGIYDQPAQDSIDTGDFYDLIVIGGGLCGLSAAYHFKKNTGRKLTCLILENHPIFGGQAKRNEFLINGERLIGPQASNAFVVIDRPGIPGYEMFDELGVPSTFRYLSLTSGLKKLQFDRTNYGFALWHDLSPNVGYLFEGASPAKAADWTLNLWADNLAGSPYSTSEKSDFITWRNSLKRFFNGPNFKPWLDTMTYKEYLERIMGLGSKVTAFADPILASGLGLGCDAISAFAAYQIGMPGFQGFKGRERERRLEKSTWHSFPGGNDGFSRYLLKNLIPDAIAGRKRFVDILNGPVNFQALDRQDGRIRMRLGAMAVRVEHDASPDRSDLVAVTYVKDGKLYRLRTRAVVMATGSWVNRRVVRDLPESYQDAYTKFHYSSVLVVNVALTNWRFLYRLNMTGCRWFNGFGYTCNIRQPMIVGDYRPPLHPDKPIILTFYIPYHYPGLPVAEQGRKGRAEILATSYGEYERKIREQMVRLFGNVGFDPRKDIGGIILNRWVYAYLNPEPGFFFGRSGRLAARDIIRKRHGRIAFGHSELDGHQNWSGAFDEGRRAANRILEIL